MKKLNRQYTFMAGTVTVEYLIVALMLMIPLWYGLVGGSGDWSDLERADNSGNLYSAPSPSEPYPGLVRVLEDKQHDFSDALNRP